MHWEDSQAESLKENYLPVNKVEEVASLLIDLVNSLATPCTILLHHVLLDRLGEPVLHGEAGQQRGHGVNGVSREAGCCRV